MRCLSENEKQFVGAIEQHKNPYDIKDVDYEHSIHQWFATCCR